MNYLTSEQNNPVDNLIEVYQSDYCITLDELPDLKSYPINGSNEPAVTTTAKTTTTTTVSTATTTASSVPSTVPKDYRKGDANCDGGVDMSDVVIIMQALANPNKYGINGTDEHHLTEQGALNGDVDKSSKGLTVNDPLEIQNYLLGKSKWD
jgi:mannan endo-1,4-beta-mannosidase